MSSEEIIVATSVSKKYDIYGVPKDRLKQALRSRISKYFGVPAKQYFTEFNALKDISFSIKRGERLGIIGKNGSGKSTLLQILCGTLTPTSGSVEIKGKVAALLELGSGFNPEFSGRENVFINAAVLGLSNEQISERIGSIIEFAGIGDFIDQPVKTYSSGMFVRLAFAVIAHVDADILVIDEALAVGDAFFNQKCMRFMDHFSKNGTIILVTHDTSAITGFCTRAIWLDKGLMLSDGDTKSVSEQYLASIYGSTTSNSESTRPAKASKHLEKVKTFRDSRQEFVNLSNLRNDLEIFQFDPTATEFGNGGAKLNNVAIFDSLGNPLSWVVGGEMVTLEIEGTASRLIENAIIGFVVKDKHGQTLFGENTHLFTLSDNRIVNINEIFQASFEFLMPIMPAGDYVISAAVADGSQENHEMLCWVHEALAFKSATSSLSTGLLGVPMKQVLLTVAN